MPTNIQLSLKTKVRKLRQFGKTYSEINNILNIKIPKSTLSNWCHGVHLPKNYFPKIITINKHNLVIARKIALKVNRQKRKKYLENIKINNVPLSKTIRNHHVGMIALAMLCLGEASKSYSKHRQFSLGSSDQRIITIFIKLLIRFPSFDPTKMRCTVQCRADQNTVALEKYWQQVTQVPFSLFYPTRIDPRTVGKRTQNLTYKGVLVIDYYDRKIQLMLESLADLVYNQLQNEGP